MSILEAPRAISFTFALVAFSLPTNGFLTGLINSTIHVSPSAGKIPVSDAPFLNANVTNPALATALSEISVASVHEIACSIVVAAIASVVSSVICTSPIAVPGLTFPYCNTYTTYNFQSLFIRRQAAVIHAQSRYLESRSITGHRKPIPQPKLIMYHTPWSRMATLSPPRRYMLFIRIYMPRGTAHTTIKIRSEITLVMLLLHMFRTLCRLLHAFNREGPNS